MVLQWNNEALECIRAVRTPPVGNARALFIIHSAAYDAWAAYDAKAVGTRLGRGLRRPSSERTTANKNQAISHAAYRAASWVWPACQASWDAQLEALGCSAGDVTTAATVGRAAADAVIAHAPTTAPTRPATTPTPAATSRSTRRHRRRWSTPGAGSRSPARRPAPRTGAT